MNSNGVRAMGGYAAWRIIADELRADISSGSVAVGSRLPTEHELAARFGVNRHTVRQSIAALTAEGLTQARRGSGTYVVSAPQIVHRIGVRTRLSNTLGSAPTTRVLESSIEPAPPEVRRLLQLGAEPATRIETLRTFDGRPLVRGTHWFDTVRLPNIDDALRRTGSVTLALSEFGIADYVRASTSVSARPATSDERAELDLTMGGVVLVTSSLDALPDGVPLHHGISRFDASRVVLDVEHAGS